MKDVVEAKLEEVLLSDCLDLVNSEMEWQDTSLFK